MRTNNTNPTRRGFFGAGIAIAAGGLTAAAVTTSPAMPPVERLHDPDECDCRACDQEHRRLGKSPLLHAVLDAANHLHDAIDRLTDAHSCSFCDMCSDAVGVQIVGDHLIIHLEAVAIGYRQKARPEPTLNNHAAVLIVCHDLMDALLDAAANCPDRQTRWECDDAVYGLRVGIDLLCNQRPGSLEDYIQVQERVMLSGRRKIARRAVMEEAGCEFMRFSYGEHHDAARQVAHIAREIRLLRKAGAKG